MAELPRPQPDDDARPFWDYVRARELRIQRCTACGTLRHPPRPMCARCRSMEVEWAPVSGRGTVFSYIVTHQPVHPALVDRVPFATVLVELEEGPRITSNLVGVPPGEIVIGMAVEVVFERLDDEVTLPLFRRV
jgi:hypothetical protein